MTDYRLARTQRNEIFAMAVNLGLDPSSFRWVEEPSGRRWVSQHHRIVHEPSGSFLNIDYSVSDFSSGYVLDHWPSYLENMHGAKDWETLRPRIRRWLEAVKRETDAPP